MGRSTTFTAGLCALFLGVGLTAPARADDWVSAGFDAGHARATAERSGGRFTSQRWSRPFAANAYGLSSPATADGIVVVGGHDGLVHAVAASDGRPLWAFRTGDSVESSPAVLNGRAFVSSQDGKLYALHLADGQLAWQHDLGGLEQSSPVLVRDRLGDGVVVAHGFPGRTLVRLDAITGDVVWETTPDVMAQFSNSSAVSDGTYLVIGANEGHYYGFDLATGTHLWTFETDGIVNLAAPVIAQGRVFLLPGGESNKVHALDVSTGKPLAGWPVEVPEPAPASSGQHLFRHYAVSSLASVPGKLIFDVRFDDSTDTDGDTLADRFLMTETVVALSTVDGHRLWQQSNGKGDVASFNDMPKSGLCPTPALYQAMSAYGNAYAVVTSTLDGTLRVLDTGTGATVWSTLLPSVSRASPLLANGRLILATDDGALLSRGSSTNTAPSAPTFTGGTVRAVSDATAAVDWAASVDLEGDAVTYQLRLDHDGEVLETWESTATLSGGTRWRIPGTLKAGTSYIVAARARDSNGAWSDWSAPQFLDVVAAPPIAVNGHGVTSLGDALRGAQAGDIVTLGVGTVVLTETLRVPGGVTLEGAGAQRTILDARGQSIAVSVDGSAPGQPSEVRGLTVTGARVGISVGNAKDARISHVILRDNSDAALDVGASGTAALTNATLVSNGVAARSFGVLVARNNLVLRNTTGLVADHVGALTSRFNDVSGNTVDYLGLVAAASDLSTSVAFTDFAKHDLRLGARQPTTDQGDPADDFSAEPQPNGGRINLGAFGGTSDAELSLAPSTSVGEPGGPPTPVEQPRHVGTTPPSATPEPGQAYSSGGGCSMAGDLANGTSLAGALILLTLLATTFLRRRAPGPARVRLRRKHRTGRWLPLCILIAGAAWSAPAAAARVQYCTGSTNGTASSVNCMWTSPTTAGNALFAVVVEGGASFQSPTTDGTGWTMGNAQQDNGNLHIRIFYNLNAASRSGSKTWTFSTPTNCSIYMAEYSGVLTSNAIDTQAATSGSSSTGSTGTTATLAQANEVAIGVVAVLNSGYTFSGTTFTEVTEKNSTDASYGLNAVFLEKIVSATTGVGTSATISGSGTWAGFVQTFKTSGGGGGGTAGLWKGGSSGNVYSATANWSNGALPSSTDTIVLDSTGNVGMVIDQDITAAGFTVSSGYTASITQSGTRNMTLTNDLTLAAASGTFTAPAGTLEIGGTFNKTGAITFTHNNGLVFLKSTTTETLATNGAAFYNLTINDGLVGYWKLDESVIGTAVDSSGYGNNLTASNSPTASTSAPSMVDFNDPYSAAFTRTSTYTTTPYLAAASLPTELQPSVVTVSAWYKATSVDTTGALPNQGGEVVSGANRYGVRVFSSSQMKVFKQTAGSTWVELTGTATNALDGNWHHIAGVITASGMTSYFDGQSTGTNSDTSAIYYTSTTSGVNIGRNPTGNNFNFSGSIDEVRIYNRALSAADMAAIYSTGMPASSPSTYTMTGSPSVAGDLVIASGTLGTSTNSLTVGGNFWNYSGSTGFSTTTGMVTFNGTSSGKSILLGGTDFNDLTISGLAGGWTIADKVWTTLTGDLAISNGTLTSTSSTLEIQGAFNKTGGTFTHNSGVVMLTSPGNQAFATNGTTFNDLIINDGLVGYWKLDETSAGTAADSSGYGNDGTATNSPVASSTVPSVEFTDPKSLSFTATSVYTTTPHVKTAALPTVLQPAVITMSAWYRATTVDASGGDIISGSNRYGIRVFSSTQMKVFKQTAVSTWVELTATVPTPLDGNWHHMAATITASGMTAYFDGLSVGSNSDTSAIYYTNSPSLVGLNIGRNPSYEDFNFSGNIDEVRIYNRALTAAEISSLALGRFPGTKSATHTMTGAPTIAGDLVIASGELSAGSNNLTVTGSWLNFGGKYTPTTSTVTFNGGSANTLLSGGQPFYAFAVNGAGSLTLADRAETLPTGAVDITAGTLALSSYTLRAGDINRGGTFTPGTGTVVIATETSRTLDTGNFTNLKIEPVTATNLVGYWKFDEGMGTTARDFYSVASGHSATLTNGPVYVDTSLPTPITFDNVGAVKLDGTNDWIDVATSPTATNAAFSACTWTKLNALTKQTILAMDGSNVSSFMIQMLTTNGNKLAMITLATDSTSGTQTQINALASPSTGTWYHVCGTYDGTNTKFYVNGALQGTGSPTAVFNGTGGLSMGSDYWSPSRSNYLNGYLDDVRVYNVALTLAQVKDLYAGTYPSAATMTGGATVTLGYNTTTSGTFAIDSGTFATSSYTLASTGAGKVNGGTYNLGSASNTFSAGLSVGRAGTLTMATTGGTLNIAGSQTLLIDGTLNASAATAATIQAVSGNYVFTIGSTSTATPTLNITKLAVKNTNTQGMNIDSVAGSTTTFTRFDNIAFSAGTGTQLLQIHSPALYLVSNGCTFDGGVTATTTYNVTLVGDSASTETRAIFGGATCASGGSTCEQLDNDDDNNTTPDGVADGSANGAVIQWVKAAMADTNGTLEGYPVAAFDWNSFTYYSSYASYHDVDGGSADRVYVRTVAGATGSAIGAARYSWDTPSGVDLVGAPRFYSNTVSMVTTRYVYVLTTAGRVYRLIDSGSALTTDASWGAGSSNGYNCGCTPVSPLGMDTTNLYFTGTISSTAYVFDISQSAGVTATNYPKSLGAVTLTAAEPALWVGSDTYTYLFAGLSGHFYKWSFNTGSLTTDNSSPTGTVNGRISVIQNKVYGNDNAGTLWVLNPTTFSSTYWSYHDNTNHMNCSVGTSCASTGGLYVDWLIGTRAFYGDGDGHLYGAYNSTGTTGAQTNSGFPYQPGGNGTSDVFASSPLYNAGILVAGTTLGTVYVIDTNNGTTGPAKIQTYRFGASTKISGIGYDNNTSSYLISTSDATAKDGNLFYIAASTDPTPTYY